MAVDATAVWAPPVPVARDRAGRGGDRGMVTVEYAIGTLAAAALATLLWTVAHSPGVLHLIEEVFARALSFPK